ncbi:MAG: TIGR00266 family protein [Pseudanabaenaceae cyanobacterium SKYGB_i_bin29]|nr:TIGR00266 family protein [Pseudanabaenaceae cyanobacterium SKYG29]MDW8422254.1 TIGR00266 family protein [Pseudanabaenaceae cyanobacterium SKYGB_i_bin29]
MEIELLHDTSSRIAKITLSRNETLLAEAGCMIAMSENMGVETTLRRGRGGGVLGGLKRLLGGESLFLSVFQAVGREAEIYIAPKLMGDILIYEMTGKELVIQAGSYIACADSVEIDLGWRGFKSMFAGESLFWLSATGRGTLLLSSFGAIYEVDVDGEYIVDTGNIVAFENTLNFTIGKPPGSNWISTFLGGEGLVCRFKGRGKLFCQSHSRHRFGLEIGPQLPPR